MNKEIIIEQLKNHIHQYPDFPKKGILFRDIMPLFSTAGLFQNTIEILRQTANQMQHIDKIVGIESRGFLLATPLAHSMGKAFVAARKKGKLPGNVVSEEYSLEYGTDTVQIQKDGIVPNVNYVIVDDLLATGGTALATARLIHKNGGHVVGFIFLIELMSLGGRELLMANFHGIPCESLIMYQ